MDKIKKDPFNNRYDDIIKRYPLPKNLMSKVMDNVIRDVYLLEGTMVNTDDFNINQGSYSLEFIIEEVRTHRIEGYYDHYGFNGVDLDITISDLEGDVDIDGETIRIGDAMSHSDFGWEVRSEIDDVIKRYIFYKVPEIQMTSIDVDVHL